MSRPWLRRWWTRALLAAASFGIAVGPWPTDRADHRGSAYERATASRLGGFPGKAAAGPIRVGVAEVDLMPDAPVPLAGFVGQIATPFVAVNSRCAARALTIAGGSSSVTLLAADLLLVDQRLARAVLARTGLPADQVYFTATHTHSGPGAWGIHPLERLVAGTYEPGWFDELAQRLAGVVLRSRARPVPAEAAFVQVDLPGLQRNRITRGDGPGATNDLLSAWAFRPLVAGKAGPVLATFASFGAHATLTHPVPPRLGGDYPAAFAAALAARGDAGVVLFAAGTVGDAAPIRPPAPNDQKGAEAYGAALAERLAPLLAAAEFRREIVLANDRLPVDLPPVQVPFFAASLRFSPAFSWWVARRTTHLHAVRIGPAVLVGFPGDYAGHLARQLRGALPVVATSFNGDYKGYLVSRSTFDEFPSYETRQMNFFGPGLGDYLTDLGRRLAGRLAGPPGEAAGQTPRGAAGD